MHIGYFMFASAVTVADTIWRRATHNVLTKQQGLSRPSRQMSDSPLGAFHLELDSRAISLTENCTNMEAQKVLCNEDWSVLRFELLAFIGLLDVWGACGGKNIS